MTDTPVDLSERMQSEGEKTLKFFGELTHEQWQISMYTEGGQWSVKDLLAHFVATEKGIQRLVENVLAGGEGSAEDFDIDAFNARKVAALKDSSATDLLAQFARYRTRSVALVAGLKPDDLARQGRHPWLGMAALEDIIKLMYRHNQIHQRDIRRAIG